MSFSFSAAGTREETLSSLSNARTNGNHVGDSARDFAITLVNEDQTEPDDSHYVRYSVSVNGHSDGGVGSASFVSLSFSAAFAPRIDTPAMAPSQ